MQPSKIILIWIASIASIFTAGRLCADTPTAAAIPVAIAPTPPNSNPQTTSLKEQEVPSVALWQGTSIGMSVADVQKLVKDARPPKDLKSGAQNGILLEVDPYKLVDNDFKINFTFTDGKLMTVILALKEDKNEFITKQVFQDLTTALRTKYGSEATLETTPMRLIDDEAFIEKATWASGKTTIQIYALISINSSNLTLTYGTMVSKEADKL